MTEFFEKKGPTELIVQILSLCDSVQDCISLALSCRRIAAIWADNGTGAAIAWQIKLRDAPSIDDALIAVSFTMSTIEEYRF